MIRTINKTLLLPMFLILSGCSNTATIECFNVDEGKITHISSYKINSKVSGITTFNYSYTLINESGKEFKYSFRNLNGRITLNSNIFSPSNENDESYVITDSILHYRQKIYVLVQKNIQLKEYRKVLCANNFNQIYGIRYGTGTPKIYLIDKDEMFAKKLYNLLKTK